MDETTKVITDNINNRLEKVENQNEKQSNDITSIKLEMQKLNNKVDNLEDKVDSLDGKMDDMTNELKAEMKELKVQWQNGLKEIDDEQRAILKNKLELAENRIREMEKNNFWNKLKNSLGDRAVSVVTVVVFILLLVGVIIAYQNGIGLL